MIFKIFVIAYLNQIAVLCKQNFIQAYISYDSDAIPYTTKMLSSVDSTCFERARDGSSCILD